ncbi:MAG TPA: SIS domain-containing protein [Symbiobacteriaceae bacterium]|nr:SIS domain-containing protein [Symbiobacteriaceae bacterium]
MATGVIARFGTLIHDVLRQIEATQAPAIEQAAGWVAETIAGDGIVYTFGTGHSHCVAEEVVYRAGGLAPVDAILEPSITGTTDVVASEFMERIEGIATVILQHRRLTPRDLLIIISNSGRNGSTVEAALTAKAMGVRTVAVTSLAYSRQTSSRHSSGKRLCEVADLVIDNGGVLGDAALHLDGLAQPVGPTSNMAALFVMHSMMALAAEKLMERGVEPPVFWSGNLDGAREKNQALLDRYWGRIKVW